MNLPGTFDYRVERSTSGRSDAERDEILANPGFGLYFTDHMFLAEWTPDTAWADGRVVPYGPLTLDPATAVLHYAQEIFEGLKAYAHADGSIWLFRPQANAARMQRSAHRLALPPLPEEWFIGSIKALLEVDSEWVPKGEEKSLYLRPFMFASEAFLGVRPAHHVTYSLIASPAGA
jgi:branched-chain amino acid aminotransferase